MRSPDAQTIDLERDVSVHGGHYATAASCAVGGIGWTGHDTAASATANLWGQIRVTARSDADQDLRVDYGNVPANATLRVSDPTGAALNPVGGAGMAGVSGSGTLNFRVSQAGVYLVRLEILTSPSVQGGAGAAQDRGTTRMRVSLAPHSANSAQ